MLDTLARFLPQFLNGLAVNFQTALWAMLLGLLLGLPLALARVNGHWLGAVASVVVAVFRATPTFVVMFFLVNVVPASNGAGSGAGAGASGWGMTPWLAVVLALAIYATSYVSDNAIDGIRQLRMGSALSALLFLMSLVRAFFVMVLSSGFGAAVGVVEGTTVTLRTIEAMPVVSDRLLLIVCVIGIFTVCFQAIYYLINALRSKLTARFI